MTLPRLPINHSSDLLSLCYDSAKITTLPKLSDRESQGGPWYAAHYLDTEKTVRNVWLGTTPLFDLTRIEKYSFTSSGTEWSDERWLSNERRWVEFDIKYHWGVRDTSYVLSESELKRLWQLTKSKK